MWYPLVPCLSNPRHELFAQAIAKGLSATDAYRAAGYKPDRKNAARLTTNDDIRTRVDEILAAGAKRAEVTVEQVVRELAKIGFSDIRKAVKWQGTLVQETDNPDGGDILVVKNIVTNHVQLLSSDEIDEDTAACISEVSQTKEGSLKIKFHDKLGALEKLGKHLGMFVEQSEVTVVHDISSEPLSLDDWLAQSETAH